MSALIAVKAKKAELDKESSKLAKTSMKSRIEGSGNYGKSSVKA